MTSELIQQVRCIRQDVESLNAKIASPMREDSVLTINSLINDLILLQDDDFEMYCKNESTVINLLSQKNFKKLLEMMLRYLLHKLYKPINRNPVFETPPLRYQTPQTRSDNKDDGNIKRLQKMIREVVTPLRIDINESKQYYSKQLSQTTKACQTLGKSFQEIKTKHQAQVRLQQSIISSIFAADSNMHSPKFNSYKSQDQEGQIKADSFDQAHITFVKSRVDTIVEPQLINKEISQSSSMLINDDTLKGQTESLTSLPKTISPKGEMKPNLKKLILQQQIAERQKKYSRFSDKNIPNDMISVDNVAKRLKTPERKTRQFDIITNV